MPLEVDLVAKHVALRSNLEESPVALIQPRHRSLCGRDGRSIAKGGNQMKRTRLLISTIVAG